MSSITGRTIINQASIQLQDAANTRWTLSELLGWLNDGQNSLITFRPDASVAILAAPLVAGSKQALPAVAQSATEFVCNVDVTGAVEGLAVRLVDRDTLDIWVPDWRTGVTVPANAIVTHVVYDGRNPHSFDAYPPNTGAGYVRVVCPVIPTAVTLDGVNGQAVDTVIGVDDIYANALLNYILYRAFQKDTDTIDPQRSQGFHQAFIQAVTVKTETDKANEPKPKHESPNSQNPYGNG